MPFSFLNGLSAMGQAVSQFAGQAGLEYQKADLAKQQLQLADQLATTREREVTQPFQQSQQEQRLAADAARNADTNKTTLAAANIGAASAANVAGIHTTSAERVAQKQLDAGEGLRQAQTNEANARAKLSDTEGKQADQLLDLHNKLAATTDPEERTKLTTQIVSMGTSAATQAAVATSLDSLAKTAQLSAESYDRQLASEVDKLNTMELDDGVRQQQQRLVQDLTIQRDRARTTANNLTDQAAGLVRSRANITTPGAAGPGGAGSGAAGPGVQAGGVQAGGDQAGGTAPAPVPPGQSSIINGAGPRATKAAIGGPTDRLTTDLATDLGIPAGGAGADPTTTSAGPASSTTAATSGGAGPASTSTTATPPPAAAANITLPGDLAVQTTKAGHVDFDALKAARPDLNIDVLRGRPPGVVLRVLQYVDGRATLPTGRSLNPQNQAWVSLALQVDPSLDEATSKVRMQTRVSFASGDDAKTVERINTTLGHTGELYNRLKALNNSFWEPGVAATNYVESKFGDSRQGQADMAINAVASEMRAVYAGSSGGNLTELENWEKSFPRDGSWGRQQAALQEAVRLLDSKLDALKQKYERGMSRKIDAQSFLTPEAAKVYAGITDPSKVPSGGFTIGSQAREPQAAPEASAAVPKPPTAPAVPAWVRPGDQYSPSRGQARGADGALYGPPS